MKSFKISGVVLKRRNFLEKDRILTIFSREEGKVDALAKGARRPGNRLGPNSDLATIAIFHIHKTKSIDIVTEIEPIYHPFGARGEFEKTELISYALKIIDKLYEVDDPHPNTYQVLCELIETVSYSRRQLVFLKFIIEIMRDLGALPEFDTCSYCQTNITSSDEYVFDLKGGLSHRNCSREDAVEICDNEIKLLRLLNNSSLEQAIACKVDKAVYENAYKVMLKHFHYEFGKLLPDKVM